MADADHSTSTTTRSNNKLKAAPAAEPAIIAIGTPAPTGRRFRPLGGGAVGANPRVCESRAAQHAYKPDILRVALRADLVGSWADPIQANVDPFDLIHLVRWDGRTGHSCRTLRRGDGCRRCDVSWPVLDARFWEAA